MNGKNPNRIIRGLWIGGWLSELERLCIRSFCANGHEFHLYAYDELQNLPQVGGLRVLNGADILPRKCVYRDLRGSFAHFSDYFRWELLRQKGGWWADMDVVCLRPFDFDEDVVFAASQNFRAVSQAVMKFPRGHFFAAAMAGACADIDRFVPWDTPRRKRRKIKRRLMFWKDSRMRAGFGEAGGPAAFALAAKHFGLDCHAQPWHLFYMIGNHLWEYALDGQLSDMGALAPLLSHSYAVHLCQSEWRIAGANKDSTFPENSLYEILKRRYPESAQNVI